MTRKRSSLRELAAKAKDPGLPAANMAAGNRIMELDPSLIHVGGVEDRIETDPREIAALAESIRVAGQKVPILVRPHPEKPGAYEVIAGRRRLAACREAGLPVRAEVQDVDVRTLIMSQAIENIAREDLSYIERARLAARMVDEAGLDPTDIDIAFTCGNTDRSRYLKIGRAIPADVILFIGKAPGIGRPRWETLAARLQDDSKALDRIREMLAAAKTEGQALSSDERFARVAAAAQASPEQASPRKIPPRREAELRVAHLDVPVGTLRRTAQGVQMTVLSKADPGFAMWLEAHADEAAEALFALYRSGADEKDDDSQGNPEQAAG